IDTDALQKLIQRHPFPPFPGAVHHLQQNRFAVHMTVLRAATLGLGGVATSKDQPHRAVVANSVSHPFRGTHSSTRRRRPPTIHGGSPSHPLAVITTYIKDQLFSRATAHIVTSRKE